MWTSGNRRIRERPFNTVGGACMGEGLRKIVVGTGVDSGFSWSGPTYQCRGEKWHRGKDGAGKPPLPPSQGARWSRDSMLLEWIFTLRGQY